MISRNTDDRRFSFGALGSLSAIRRLAVAASAVWLIVAVTYAAGFLMVAAGSQTRGTVFLDAMFFLIALILPLLLIWISARFAEELQVQKEVVLALAELTAPLSAELSATRQVLADNAPRDKNDSDRVNRERQSRDIAEIAARLARLQDSVDRLTLAWHQEQQKASEQLSYEPVAIPEREAPPAPDTRDDQMTKPDQSDLPSPNLDTPERPEWNELVRALDFPRDDKDFDGFRALQSVLKYPPLAQLLQSAEDVLTLLSQKGIYMDEIPVEDVEPDHWRKFFSGARGASVSGANLVQDPHTIETAGLLLRSDPIFRDAAMFFQRRFGQALSGIVPDANDQEILEISNTRSGRAYMLLAALGGAFDD